MNKTEYGNYAKLIAFFLVAALLVAGFGFATEGWWISDNQNIPSGTSDKDDLSGINPDEDIPVTVEPEFKPPEYTNLLTGLETTEELSRKRHYAFVIDPTSPMYGIFGNDMTMEFPVEDGGTRLLVFANDISNLRKIGSLLPTRSYISNSAKFFNSVIVAKGNDGKLHYDRCDMNGSFFDMSAHSGYSYTEYIQFTYTSGDLISAGVYNANVNTSVSNEKNLPYNFADFQYPLTPVGFSAKSVIIPFSEKSETELYFSADTGMYSFNKNGTPKSDMMSDKKITYKNLFILFADTMTYEGQSGTEMVMNTIGEGSGYYITNGIGQNITWKSDVMGNLTFYSSSGEKLTVNRGSSYIGYTKSSKTEEVKFS